MPHEQLDTQSFSVAELPTFWVLRLCLSLTLKHEVEQDWRGVGQSRRSGNPMVTALSVSSGFSSQQPRGFQTALTNNCEQLDTHSFFTSEIAAF